MDRAETSETVDPERPIEVKVFQGDDLVAVRHCADETEVAAMVERWHRRPAVTFLVDQASPGTGPERVVRMPGQRLGVRDQEDRAIALAPVPARGVE